MTAKQYLSRYQEINREIDALVEDCARLRSLAERVGCGQLDSMPKAANADPSAQFTRAIEQIIAKEAEINRRIDEMMVVKKEIATSIVSVDEPNLRFLLWARYLNSPPPAWGDVAAMIGRTEDMTRKKLHGRALRKIQDIVSAIDG